MTSIIKNFWSVKDRGFAEVSERKAYKDCFLLVGKVNGVRDGNSFIQSVCLFGGARGTGVLNEYVSALIERQLIVEIVEGDKEHWIGKVKVKRVKAKFCLMKKSQWYWSLKIFLFVLIKFIVYPLAEKLIS